MFIQDDNFLTYEEQVDFANQIFSNYEPNWKVWRALEIMNIPGQREKLPKSLVLATPDSYNTFQVVQDLNNNEYEYVFSKFCDKHNIKPKTVIRARINILTRSDYDNYNYPHVDNAIPHDVFLYYFNSADGNTVIFDKKLGDDISNPKDLPVLHSVEPKMGTAIKFDGRYYHSSTSPKESQIRCILNIDYKE